MGTENVKTFEEAWEEHLESERRERAKQKPLDKLWEEHVESERQAQQQRNVKS